MLTRTSVSEITAKQLPTPNSDFYYLADLLNADERAILQRVRTYMEFEQFFQQFSGPMTARWKTLGSPVLTPEVQRKLIDSVRAEVGSRTVVELELERDEILLGLIEPRTKGSEAVAPREVAAEQRSAARGQRLSNQEGIYK